MFPLIRRWKNWIFEGRQVSGSLTEVAREAAGAYRVGEFTVTLKKGRSGDTSEDFLSVTHRSRRGALPRA